MQNMQNLSASLNAATLQQVLKGVCFVSTAPACNLRRCSLPDMTALNRYAADTARGAAKFHEYSGYALAGAPCSAVPGWPYTHARPHA